MSLSYAIPAQFPKTGIENYCKGTENSENNASLFTTLCQFLRLNQHKLLKCLEQMEASPLFLFYRKFSSVAGKNREQSSKKTKADIDR